MKELVVISGKGGTGKTSITAAFAALAHNKVMVDCDVDAADMHLILNPEVLKSEDFFGGKEAVINKEACTECGECGNLCRFDAIVFHDGTYSVNPLKCEGCGVCSHFCPSKAIELNQKRSGEWYISDTRHGPLVHGALGIAEDNSGKMVSKIREEAKALAKERGCNTIIIDGSPGIGCPVIASITGASMVLIVTEPTVSGFHDLKRVVELIKHFNIKGMVCINKYDLNTEMTETINQYCKDHGIELGIEIPYDTGFTKAQIEARSIVEFSSGGTSKKVQLLWEKISNELGND